jgi:hypothetical protein
MGFEYIAKLSVVKTQAKAMADRDDGLVFDADNLRTWLYVSRVIAMVE